MKFVSLRELRNEPGRVQAELKRGELVLTASGKPVGVIIPAGEDDLDETLSALRRARAIAAVSRLRERARATGRDRLSAAEIDREIRAARRYR
jgi:antitoxin (DNA-binding transcriptional repressor) of toxin-antitoxin stability system